MATYILETVSTPSELLYPAPAQAKIVNAAHNVLKLTVWILLCRSYTAEKTGCS
jgi:hypothetical protein